MEDVYVAVVFLLIWILCMIVVALAVGMYILRALAYQKVMRKYNYRKTWMAWIPFAQHYALADAASEGKSTMKFFSADCPAWFFKFWFLVAGVGAFVPFIGGTAAFVYTLLFQGNIYRTIYARAEKRSPGSRTAIALFSTIIELIPIIKFLCYNKEKIEPLAENPAPEPAVPLLTAVQEPAAEPAPEPVASPVPEVKTEEPEAAAKAVSFCPACGSPVVPGSVFCIRCGNKLVQEPVKAEIPETVSETVQEAEETAEAVRENASEFTENIQ